MYVWVFVSVRQCEYIYEVVHCQNSTQATKNKCTRHPSVRQCQSYLLCMVLFEVYYWVRFDKRKEVETKSIVSVKSKEPSQANFSFVHEAIFVYYDVYTPSFI